MASIAVSTPSPPARVHTPGTPKHGYSDPWEPFSPRKSARISSQRSNARTPSPRTSQHHQQHQHQHQHQQHRGHRKSSSTFSTPATSPQKKRMPAMDSVRRASGALTAESTSHAADSLGIGTKPQPRQQKSHTNAAASQYTAAMLPTPTKTPRKPTDAKTEAASHAVARNLFHSDTDVVPTPKKKKAKKYTGLTLQSFTAEEIDDPINIFTDSRDRLPELDNSVENPFYGNDAAPAEESSKRRSKRKQVSIPGEGRQSIEEAIRREDGIVYVFRGKKFFRKFSELHEASSSEQLDADEEDEASPHRPITRSSVKPRLLFPRTTKGKNVAATTTTIEDEEAVTDIEDHVLNDAEDGHIEAPETPVKVVDSKPDTPEAPRFGPTSPPSTVRATRSTTKLLAEDSPIKKMGKPRSPFDGWRRSKSRAEPHGQKREGEVLGGAHASKRQRS